jgi:hypothetical protein
MSKMTFDSLSSKFLEQFDRFSSTLPGALFHSDLRVEIGRDKAQLNAGINIGFTVILVVALFFMGLEIDLRLVLKVLKRPIGPTIGMVSQFLFMPVCAYGLGELLLLEGKS